MRSQTPYNSMRMDTPNNTNPVGSKANPTRMDTLHDANSIYDSTNARSVRTEVRPSELIELSNAYEQTPSYAQAAPCANYANSYRYSEPITANGTPIVRWSEPPLTGSNPRRTTLTPITQTPDLFIPDKSVYYTARQTDRCSRERLTNTDIRRRRTLEFDSAVEVHEAPRNCTKNDDANTRYSSRNSRRSSSRTRSESNSRADSAQRSSRSSTRTKHKRRTSSSRSEERSMSRSVSSNRRTRRNRTPSHESNSEESSTDSSSSEDESTLSKSKHMLKPPKFDGQTSFETFWAQFTNCAEHNK